MTHVCLLRSGGKAVSVICKLELICWASTHSAFILNENNPQSFASLRRGPMVTSHHYTQSFQVITPLNTVNHNINRAPCTECSFQWHTLSKHLQLTPYDYSLCSSKILLTFVTPSSPLHLSFCFIFIQKHHFILSVFCLWIYLVPDTLLVRVPCTKVTSRQSVCLMLTAFFVPLLKKKEKKKETKSLVWAVWNNMAHHNVYER